MRGPSAVQTVKPTSQRPKRATHRNVREADAIKALRILLKAAREDEGRITAELSRVMDVAEHNRAVITTYEHRLEALGVQLETETEAQAS